MLNKEKKILDVFSRAISKMSEQEREKLLAFGEGMAFMASQQKQSPINQEQKSAS